MDFCDFNSLFAVFVLLEGRLLIEGGVVVCNLVLEDPALLLPVLATDHFCVGFVFGLVDLEASVGQVFDAEVPE
jgi:hypothetical protein